MHKPAGCASVIVLENSSVVSAERSLRTPGCPGKLGGRETRDRSWACLPGSGTLLPGIRDASVRKSVYCLPNSWRLRLKIVCPRPGFGLPHPKSEYSRPGSGFSHPKSEYSRPESGRFSDVGSRAESTLYFRNYYFRDIQPLPSNRLGFP